MSKTKNNNKMLKVAITVVAVLIVLSFVKDMVIKISVEKGMQLVTGLRLNMGGFNVGLLRTVVGIRNLVLFNPAGYKDRTMLNMPEVYVHYDLPAIIGGKIHLPEVRIDMKEFMVVKNEKGELNLNSLKVVQAQKEGKKPEAKAAGKAPQIQIDDLTLKIGKVIYKDYSKGGAPTVMEYNVNVNERYKNITNPYALVSLIVVKSLSNTAIASLANFDLQGLQGTISDTLRSAQKIATQAVTQAQTAAKEAIGKTQTVAKETQETVKKTTEELKQVFSVPFGTKKE